MIVVDKKAELVQRCIYISDILKRFVVLCPSVLKDFSLDELRWLFYTKAPEI